MSDYTLESVSLPADVVPVADGIEYPCEVCGREAGPYGGRGRKPKYCDLHKKGARKTGTAPKNNNAVLAKQATDALVQMNGLFGTGIYVLGFPETSSAIAERSDAFEEQAYNALLTDPALCRMILRGGTTSGKLALLIAYSMLAGGVAPTAITEYRDRRAEKIAEREAAQ